MMRSSLLLLCPPALAFDALAAEPGSRERLEWVERARRILEERRGNDYVYRPPIGDREPPLDYRVSKRP